MGALQRYAVVLFCCGVLCSTGARAVGGQNKPEKPIEQNYLWARLATQVDIAKLKVGDPITGRVDTYWSSGHCSVPRGNPVQGRVTALAANGKATQISVVFTIVCGNGTTAQMTLIAVLYPKEDANPDQMQTYMAMPAGLGTGASGRQSTDLSHLPSPGAPPPAAPKVKVGQVTGVKHLALKVSASEPGSSTLAVTDQKLRLEQGTRLAFQLAQEGK
jgi:hypothetical protein